MRRIFDEKQNYSVNMIDFMFKTGKSWMSIPLGRVVAPTNVVPSSEIKNSGRINDFREGLRYTELKAVLFRGSRGILRQKSFKIELLGNGISGIMRRNQPVIMSHFFPFRELDRMPRIRRCFNKEVQNHDKASCHF